MFSGWKRKADRSKVFGKVAVQDVAVSSRFGYKDCSYPAPGFCEDKIGVVKINIYVSVCEIRPVASPLSIFFLRLFSSMCGSRLANKANEIGPLRAPLTRNVYFARVCRLFTRYCLGETIFACVSVPRAFFFWRERCRRGVVREIRLNPPSILRYFRPFARSIPHSELCDADDRCM